MRRKLARVGERKRDRFPVINIVWQIRHDIPLTEEPIGKSIQFDLLPTFSRGPVSYLCINVILLPGTRFIAVDRLERLSLPSPLLLFDGMANRGVPIGWRRAIMT